MNASLKRLFTPFGYLRIEREGKVIDEVVLPSLLLLGTLSVFYLLDGRVNIFRSGGVIASVVGFLQFVTGFYIASLAAVSTFNKESMDEYMPGAPTVLKSRRRKKLRTEQLTRRRFLCFLFGYLSFVAIVLYFAGSALILVAAPVKNMIGHQLHFWLKWSVVSVYLYVLYHMLVTTLLGLYYMTDRIHRPTAKVSKNYNQEVSQD